MKELCDFDNISSLPLIARIMDGLEKCVFKETGVLKRK